MRTRAVLATALLVCACGAKNDEKAAANKTAEPPTKADAEQPQADPAPEEKPEEKPEQTPTADPEKAAREAYAATIDAFNRVNRDEYFAGFSFPLACFYGKPDHTEEQFRAARGKHFPEGEPPPEFEGHEPEHGGVSVEVLVTVRASPEEVVLIDFGLYGASEDWGIPRLHEKVILMRPDAGKWKIAGEFGKKIGKCDPALETPIDRPELVEKCAAKLEECRKECADDCESHGVHGCTMCQERCIDGTARCFDPSLEDPYDEEP